MHSSTCLGGVLRSGNDDVSNIFHVVTLSHGRDDEDVLGSELIAFQRSTGVDIASVFIGSSVVLLLSGLRRTASAAFAAGS